MNTSKNIPINQIEAELTRLWEAEGKTNKIKACLFNLIIYTDEKRRTEYFWDVVHKVIEKYPSRIIFIEGGHPDPNHLEVSVSNLRINKKGALIACDQITIEAGAAMQERVPFTILPLLIPDLPVYLLWGQDPTRENTILPQLLGVANRLIFDAECSKNLPTFSKKVLEQMEAMPGDVMDINWALTSGWRDVLAQIFASKAKHEQLKRFRSLKIVYNDRSTEWIHHRDIPAIYLQAWLASQLDWKATSITDDTLTYASQEGPVTVQLVPLTREEIFPGSILSVEFTSHDDQCISVQRQGKLAKVAVHISTLQQCDLPYTLPLPDFRQGIAFLREIFFEKTGDHYKQMLKTIAATPWRSS